MNETHELVNFVANTRFEDLPPDVINKAKGYVLDNFACGLVGSVQPWSKMVAEMVREAGCKEECTVFGQGWRTSPSGAALVNGTMIGGFETDHGYFSGSAHPGSALFSAVTAMAEREHKDGKSFLTAMVLGYEGVCRIGEAATRAVEDKRGYHGPGTNAPFGAAIAVGRLLGFDEVMLANAMGIAGSHSAGLYEFVWEGAMTKRLHLGRGSHMGLESAILASKGFTGPSTVLEGKYGFFNVFSPSPQPERLLADVGKVWVMREVSTKFFAIHGTQRSVVESLLEFKSRHRIDPRAIQRVVVTGCKHMLYKHDDNEPTTIMGAQLSMPFAVAVTLLKDISNPLVYNEETLWDKEVRELAKKVETVVDKQRFDQFAADLGAEVTIELDGKQHVVNVMGFKGSVENPFNFEDFCNKFRQYSVQFIGEKQANEVIDKVTNIEQLADMAELAQLIGA